jgi:hypothetical protein
MVPEFLENDRLRLFEIELRSCVSDDNVDYGRILNVVFEKVRKAEAEGPLSVLKMDEMVPGTLLQEVEYGVHRRIAEYLEFDEPVDQCIVGDRRVPERYWSYLERKINEKIDDISPVSRQEQVIKADEILDQGKIEAVEKALFARIRDYENRKKSAGKVTALFGFSRLLPLAASVLLAASAIAGYVVYRDSIKTIPIVVYQAQGANLETFNKQISSKGIVQSEKGGALTIVNKKGYVELRNGSNLEIVKASEKEVHYRARFADADKQLVGRGSATFFVNRQKKNEKYFVATRDYRIEVTGTYFRLQPDIDDHVSVAVREGEVKILFNGGETKFLKAGQTLAYDLNTNTFNTVNDGMTIPRQEIEQLPDIKDLDEYGRVSIRATPAAAVRIDGRYVGMTPLLILQPVGEHAVTIERKGFRTIDTAIAVAQAGGGAYAFTMTKAAVAALHAFVPKDNHKETLLRHKTSGGLPSGEKEPPVSAALPSAYSDSDFRDAEDLEAKNWQKAFVLYRNVFQNPRTPKLRRETALFSMAKLEAENGVDKAVTKEAFLHYLALFPTGNFVGESWLRLAELEFENDQNKAIEYYQRYFEKYPRHSRISELQYRVGLMYMQMKKYDDAISMFKFSLANYQGGDAVESAKIKASLFKAYKEKNESQTDLPAAAAR